MELNNTVCINDEIDATDLNGERVMMNLEKGKYFALNDVGSRIWNIIEEEKEVAVQKIIDKLLDEYDVQNDTCKNAVVNFINKLRDEELVVVK